MYHNTDNYLPHFVQCITILITQGWATEINRVQLKTEKLFSITPVDERKQLFCFHLQQGGDRKWAVLKTFHRQYLLVLSRTGKVEIGEGCWPTFEVESQSSKNIKLVEGGEGGYDYLRWRRVHIYQNLKLVGGDCIKLKRHGRQERGYDCETSGEILGWTKNTLRTFFSC